MSSEVLRERVAEAIHRSRWHDGEYFVSKDEPCLAAADAALAAQPAAGEIDVERLANVLRQRVLELQDLAGAHMAGHRTDDLWRAEATAIADALQPASEENR